jgi:hypothetical protein
MIGENKNATNVKFKLSKHNQDLCISQLDYIATMLNAYGAVIPRLSNIKNFRKNVFSDVVLKLIHNSGSP